jgi:dTMP kinase
MYIAIEGIDTAGKSTQISALAEFYHDAIITKEPGATPIGKEIRELVLSACAQSKKAEFLLFLAKVQALVKCNKVIVVASVFSPSLKILG